MPRSLTSCILMGVVLAFPAVAHAANGSPTDPGAGCATVIDGDSVEVECREVAPRPVPKRNGVVGAPQPCRWVPASGIEGWDPGAYGDLSPSGYQFTQRDDGAVGRVFPDGRSEVVFERVCPDGSQGFVFIDTSITVRDVIDDAVDRARRAVPAPSLDLSPSPEAGGIVNLGLWLALAGQDRLIFDADPNVVPKEAKKSSRKAGWDEDVD